MIKQFYVYVFLAVCIIACDNSQKDILLWQNTNSKSLIKYEKSEKYGNFISIVKNMNNKETNYVLRLNENGEIMQIIKLTTGIIQTQKKDLDYYRNMWCLVSDSSRDVGPSFFSYPINGLYTDTFLVNNIIFNKKTNTLFRPIDEYEKSMFILVDSITKVKDINYIQFDTSKVIGWIKYDF